MSAGLQDHLEAVGRLLELSDASESPGFRDYADRQRAVALARLDVAATARAVNKKIVGEYCDAVAALSLTRRVLRTMRGGE
jgi:hypothetical protein